MLELDDIRRIRTIFLHDGSAVSIVDFVMLLGWSIPTFEAAVKWRVVTLEEDAAGVPRISHAQLLEKARDQWSEAQIAAALGCDAARVHANTQPAAGAASLIHDAVDIQPAAALQVRPLRRSRSRAPVLAPPPPLASTRRRRADGVREVTLSAVEITPRKAVPMLRVRGQWLARVGFNIGSRLYITVPEGKLVLTVEDPAEALQHVPMTAAAVTGRAMSDGARG